MPLLFSYGMLQKESVQLATFGRRLEGSTDELVGFEEGLFTVVDPAFVEESGKADHAMVRYTGRRDDRVEGVVLEMTDEELEQADGYEPDGYYRVSTTLASGRNAWVYAGTPAAGSMNEETQMERATPILPGDDLAVMKEFYVDKLGFEVTFEATEDGKTGLMGVARGTIQLTVDCPMPGHGRGACCSLDVHDADALYEEWKDKVDIERPPTNEEWGARTFGVQDPADNTLFVIGPLV